MTEEQANTNSDTPTENATATMLPPAKKPVPSRPKELPQYKVLLHNDNVNSFEHVVRSIIQLTTITMEQALQNTIEAHTHGLSLLLITHRERAELYHEQFLSLSLSVTIEPA